MTSFTKPKYITYQFAAIDKDKGTDTENMRCRKFGRDWLKFTEQRVSSFSQTVYKDIDKFSTSPM